MERVPEQRIWSSLTLSPTHQGFQSATSKDYILLDPRVVFGFWLAVQITCSFVCLFWACLYLPVFLFSQPRLQPPLCLWSLMPFFCTQPYRFGFCRIRSGYRNPWFSIRRINPVSSVSGPTFSARGPVSSVHSHLLWLLVQLLFSLSLMWPSRLIFSNLCFMPRPASFLSSVFKF